MGVGQDLVHLVLLRVVVAPDLGEADEEELLLLFNVHSNSTYTKHICALEEKKVLQRGIRRLWSSRNLSAARAEELFRLK